MRKTTTLLAGLGVLTLLACASACGPATTPATAPASSTESSTSVEPSHSPTPTPEPSPEPSPSPEPAFHVAKTGSDKTGDGSAANPWATVQHGINAMPAGTTLLVGAGVYKEKLVNIKSGLSADAYTVIAGEPGATVVLDGTGVAGSNMIYLKNRSFVRIQNLEIRNNALTYGDANIGILVESTTGSVGVQLVGNHIHHINGEAIRGDKEGDGIAVYGAGRTEASAVKDLLIQGNEVDHCKLGQSEAVVVNGNVVHWQIVGNYVHDNDNIGIDAIGGEGTSTGQFDRARGGVIAGNVVVNNIGWSNPTYDGDGGADGIYVDGGRDIEVHDNYVAGSAYGIEVASENGASFRPSGIVVRNNISTGNTQAGLLLGGTDGARDVLADHNTIYQTKETGIEINLGPGPYTVTGNIVITAGLPYVGGERQVAPAWSGNLYFGGPAKPPRGDADGVVAPSLPVISKTNLTPTAAYQSYGAQLTTATTPFLAKVMPA